MQQSHKYLYSNFVIFISAIILGIAAVIPQLGLRYGLGIYATIAAFVVVVVISTVTTPIESCSLEVNAHLVINLNNKALPLAFM